MDKKETSRYVSENADRELDMDVNSPGSDNSSGRKQKKKKNVARSGHKNQKLSDAVYPFDPSDSFVSLRSKHTVRFELFQKKSSAQKAVWSDSPQKAQGRHTSRNDNVPAAKETAISYDSLSKYNFDLSDVSFLTESYASDIKANIVRKDDFTVQKKKNPPSGHANDSVFLADLEPASVPKRMSAAPEPAPAPKRMSSTGRTRTKARPKQSVYAPAPGAAQRTDTVSAAEPRSKTNSSIGSRLSHASKSARETTSDLAQQLTDRFYSSSINMRKIEIAIAVLAAVLVLFIGYVSISVIRNRHTAGGNRQPQVESSVSSPKEEALPDYCPHLTLNTRSVAIKPGEHFSAHDYIGTISDDLDTQETLSQNLMIIGYDKFNENKRGTYRLGLYVLDSDDNRSNVEYLDIIVK